MTICRRPGWVAAAVLGLVLVSSYAYQAESQMSPGGAADGAPMSASELQALVAPIALYPDQLVAQILSAATFPDQVAIADYWLHQNLNLSGATLTKTVEHQSWDASVKALTEFPSVLDNMAKNLSWTSSLGEAYHNQPSEVMGAIQVLRAKAKAAGNLKSTPQMTVVQQGPQTILIEPANPQVVYVPEYNPAVIYGTPYVVPGYTAAEAAAAGVIGFGAGVAVGAAHRQRVGLELLEYRLEPRRGGLQPQHLLRQRSVARRLLQRRLSPRLRLPQSVRGSGGNRLPGQREPGNQLLLRIGPWTSSARGRTMTARSEGRMPSAALVTGSAGWEAGNRERTASAGGAACTREDSAGAGLGAASVAEAASMAVFAVSRAVSQEG